MEESAEIVPRLCRRESTPRACTKKSRARRLRPPSRRIANSQADLRVASTGNAPCKCTVGAKRLIYGAQRPQTSHNPRRISLTIFAPAMLSASRRSTPSARESRTQSVTPIENTVQLASIMRYNVNRQCRKRRETTVPPGTSRVK